VAQYSCCILTTNELDEGALSPQALLAGYKGHKRAERGFRFLKDPLFLASSLYLKKPQRIMALLMVMTMFVGVRRLGISHPHGPQSPSGDLS